jgi:hypothetical protein
MLSRSSCPALFDYGKVAAPWMFFTGNIQIMTALSRIGKKNNRIVLFYNSFTYLCGAKNL